MQLSDRFSSALVYASKLHQQQPRKGVEVPYISHLLAVASLILEEGGDEDEAIVGLLHDAVEDCGGPPVLKQIRGLFGERVAVIVDGCTDAYETPKPPWKERKIQYLDHLDGASESILRVSNADKLHNTRSLLFDYQEVGESLWERFKPSKAETLWYYRAVADKFTKLRSGKPLARELETVIGDLERAAVGKQS